MSVGPEEHELGRDVEPFPAPGARVTHYRDLRHPDSGPKGLKDALTTVNLRLQKDHAGPLP